MQELEAAGEETLTDCLTSLGQEEAKVGLRAGGVGGGRGKREGAAEVLRRHLSGCPLTQVARLVALLVERGEDEAAVQAVLAQVEEEAGWGGDEEGGGEVEEQEQQPLDGGWDQAAAGAAGEGWGGFGDDLT